MALNSDLTILRRYIKPNRGDLSFEGARDFLRFDFDPKDRKRMQELADKGQRGDLTPSEQQELASYRRVGRLVDFMRLRRA
jgi:hypothetical protein